MTARVETAPDGANVQQGENGLFVIWAGPSENPVAIVTDEVGLLKTAERLVRAATPSDPRLKLAGEVSRFSIRAPEHGGPGRLTVALATETVTFLMDWDALIGLAELAQKALASVVPPSPPN